MAKDVTVRRRADGAVEITQGEARIVLALACDAPAVAAINEALGLASNDWTAGRQVGLEEGIERGRSQVGREIAATIEKIRQAEQAGAERVRTHLPLLDHARPVIAA